MNKNKMLKVFMILISILLCIPSIVYLINNKTVSEFDGYYTFFLHKSGLYRTSIISGTIVVGALLIFSVIYFLIIKKEKEIFKNKKHIYLFIIVIAFIFMMILPYLSSDVFYYMGDGWISSKYHQNPYYTTVKDLQDSGINDEILTNTGHWKHTTSIYGPVWNAISILLVSFSFGSVTIALFIYKIAALIVHIINCYLIGKITKSNKYILLYGLNPLILFELLSNVHNDSYLILFLLLALYFLVKKKNIVLTVLFLILSITIKYSTVLIVPFMLLYYFRKNSIPKRILCCVAVGSIIILSIILLYMPFYRDISIFKNMLVQDGKYTQSFMALLMMKTQNSNMFKVINILKIPLLGVMYIFMIIKTLLKDKFDFKYVMRKHNIAMLFFIFICLTTFQKWYVLWLIPTIIWQRKNMRNFILYLTSVAMIPSFNYFYIENDAFRYGIYYSTIMVVLAFLILVTEIIINRGGLNVKACFNRWKQYNE